MNQDIVKNPNFREKVLSEICVIASQLTGTGTVEESSHLEHDLDFDSLDKFELIVELEDHFDTNIDESVMVDKITTVKDVIDYMLTYHATDVVNKRI